MRHLLVGAHLVVRCLSQCLGRQELAMLKHHATCFQALLDCSLCLPTLPFRPWRGITFCNESPIAHFAAYYGNIKETPAPLKITAWTLLVYGNKRGLFAVRGCYIFLYNTIPHKFRSAVKQKVSSSGKDFSTKGYCTAIPEQRRGWLIFPCAGRFATLPLAPSGGDRWFARRK